MYDRTLCTLCAHSKPCERCDNLLVVLCCWLCEPVSTALCAALPEVCAAFYTLTGGPQFTLQHGFDLLGKGRVHHGWLRPFDDAGGCQWDTSTHGGYANFGAQDENSEFFLEWFM